MSFKYGKDRILVDHGARITKLEKAVKIAQEEFNALKETYGNTEQLDSAISRLNEALENKRYYERK